MVKMREERERFCCIKNDLLNSFGNYLSIPQRKRSFPQYQKAGVMPALFYIYGLAEVWTC